MGREGLNEKVVFEGGGHVDGCLGEVLQAEGLCPPMPGRFRKQQGEELAGTQGPGAQSKITGGPSLASAHLPAVALSSSILISLEQPTRSS